MQASAAFGAVAPEPTMRALPRDTELARDVRHGSTQTHDPFDQQQSSANVQSCITV